MAIFDRGSAILIEISIKQQAPFGALSYVDPSTITATVTDPVGAVVVNAVTPTRSATGKYYLVCQTETDWQPGYYQVDVAGTVGSYNDVTIQEIAFQIQ